MPMPEGLDLASGYSPILTNIGLSFLPKLDQFIARKVFPVVPTAVPAGQYNVWGFEDFLRRQGKRIANYEAVPLAGFNKSKASYSVDNWGLGTPYTARDLAEARAHGTPDQKFKNAKSRFVITQGVLELEFRFRDLVQTAANWTTTMNGVTTAPDGITTFLKWNQTAADPVDLILRQKRRMRFLSGGFTPNTMILPDQVWIEMRNLASMIDKIKYGGTMDRPTEVTLQQFQALTGLKNIYVTESVYNTAAEGQPANIVDMYTDTVWLGYVNDDPGIDEPSAGYQFSWTGSTTVGLPVGTPGGEGPNNFDSVENEEGLFMRDYFDKPRAAWIIEAMLWRTPNVVAPSLGMTFTDVI